MTPDIESLIAAAQTRHRVAPEIVKAAYCNWCLKDWPCPDRLLIDALAAAPEPTLDAERLRAAERHVEPHDCPRSDPASACDFNRYVR